LKTGWEDVSEKEGELQDDKGDKRAVRQADQTPEDKEVWRVFEDKDGDKRRTDKAGTVLEKGER